MTAGKLDRKVQLIAVITSNTPTGVVSSEEPIGTTWAGRRDVSDAEKISAGMVQSTLATRFLVRSSSVTRGLKPKDRLIEGSLRFEITGIKEVGRRDMLEITATTSLDP